MPQESVAYLHAAVISKVLVDGQCDARARGTGSMLSFWGGYDPERGTIIDHRHPLCGESLTGCVFVLPKGKGSSTGSAVLLDALVAGTAPVGIIMNAVDEIISLGVVIWREFYDQSIPVVVVEDKAQFDALVEADHIKIDTEAGKVFY